MGPADSWNRPSLVEKVTFSPASARAPPGRKTSAVRSTVDTLSAGTSLEDARRYTAGAFDSPKVTTTCSEYSLVSLQVKVAVTVARTVSWISSLRSVAVTVLLSTVVS
jgi:hypothetical protein